MTGQDLFIVVIREILVNAVKFCSFIAHLHNPQDIVQMFASVPDPDFPGHVILEQFQAQVRNVKLKHLKIASPTMTIIMMTTVKYLINRHIALLAV